MKKLLCFAALTVSLLWLCGCAPTVEVDGERYTALTERQRMELVAYCRACIQKNARGKISSQELAFIRKNAPEIRIDYTGDCYGNAVIAWHLPRKTIDMKISGDLLAERPHIMLGISAPEAPRTGIQPDKSTY